MTLENYITEAISTGKHRSKYHDEEINADMSLAECVSVLEEMGYVESDACVRRECKEKCYSVHTTTSTNTALNIRNPKFDRYAAISFPFGIYNSLKHGWPREDWPKDKMSLMFMTEFVKNMRVATNKLSIDELNRYITG